MTCPLRAAVLLLVLAAPLFDAAVAVCAENSTRYNIVYLLNLLDTNYVKSLRPPAVNSSRSETATEVWLNVYVQSFSSVSVEKMEYEIDFFLRQRWNDPRLSFLNCSVLRKQPWITLDSSLIQKLWVPDVFFPNVKKALFHDVTLPNRLIRIYPNGDVQYSTRITAVASCNMDLVKFPMDTQHCHLRIESYGYTMNELKFRWSTDVHPVQLNDHLMLPRFATPKELLTSECEVSYITGNFTCLQVNFKLVREYGYYIIQTYVPSILIVMLSWVSFWITIGAVPARISLGVLTVLNVTTQSAGLWMTLPRVSYIKAIDLWMSTCVIFVFSAMLEFAFVNTLVRKEVRQMTLKMKHGDTTKDMSSTEAVKHALQDIAYGTAHTTQRPNSGIRNRKLARQVDKAARVIFPVAFIMFNIVYWLTYHLI